MCESQFHAMIVAILTFKRTEEPKIITGPMQKPLELTDLFLMGTFEQFKVIVCHSTILLYFNFSS